MYGKDFLVPNNNDNIHVTTKILWNIDEVALYFEFRFFALQIFHVYMILQRKRNGKKFTY